jgi:hypothetical protein
MTIMIQSYMYGSAPPNDPPQSIIRRKNRRKRQATAEDGLNGHGNGNGNGWKEERQPLLPALVVRDRDRSISPEQVKRGHGDGR